MRQALGRLAALAACVFAATAQAQDPAQAYPTKTIRIVVGFPPGGATDTLARMAAARLQEHWSQPVVVENRAGAAGNIAHEAVAKAAGDGYTLLFTSTPLTINPSLYKSVGYDPIRDFAPVTMLATVPSLLLVPANSPSATFEQFLAATRAAPGKMNYASAGSGTPQHLAMELLKSMAGLDVVHVPYKGGAAAITVLLAAQSDSMFAAFPEAVPYIKGGRLRALAISSKKRSPLMPTVRTIDESGVAGFEVVGWQGLLAPAAVPKSIVDKLHGVILEGMQRPEVKARFDTMGLDFSGAGPDEFRAFLRGEVGKWAKVVAQSGAKVD